jgi:predicted nucleic acid-binding protein
VRAFALIADAALHREIIIVSSDYVKFEIEKIADPLKRKDIRGFERALSSVNVTSGEGLVELATEFRSKCSLNSLDALHVSASCLGEADFLTCDDEISDEKDYRESCG